MGCNVQLRAASIALLIGAAGALAACDSGPSALPARDHSQAALDRAARETGAQDRSDPARPERRPYISQAKAQTPMFHGRPLWSSSQKYSAEDNVAYHFKRDGAALGAASPDDFVAKTHAFIDAPPKGALVRVRTNGDKLIYDPRSNVFAVATREGAPRTIFKPDNGRAYWDQQMAKEAKTARAGDDGDTAG